MKNRNKQSEGLVYSTDEGRICPDCSRAASSCICKSVNSAPKGDGVVRVRTESKGRGGKVVTVITGVPLSADELKKLGKLLKVKCGCGGTTKNGAIEIQGNHQQLVIAELKAEGFVTK